MKFQSTLLNLQTLINDKYSSSKLKYFDPFHFISSLKNNQQFPFNGCDIILNVTWINLGEKNKSEGNSSEIQFIKFKQQSEAEERVRKGKNFPVVYFLNQRVKKEKALKLL